MQIKSSKTTLSKIGISIIASVLLSQNLAAADIANNALPSGGKFTHGSGSIKVNGKEMNITGNNTNHIIAWGGGFNIGKDAEVNFNTSHGRQAAFLNLDYTNKASQILGNLNGNGNNIYLVNPSGVLIGQNASINANKFVASNTIDNTTLNSFKTQTKLVESFSPVYKPNKGNVVNLGHIKANDIILIGNEVRNQAIVKENGKEVIVTGSFSGYDSKNPNQTNASTTSLASLELRGEKIDLALDNVKIDTHTTINLLANNPINITQSTESLYHNGDRLNHNFTISSLDSANKTIPTANKYASISDITDWYYFANGINDKIIDQTQINDFRLINDIDFSAGSTIHTDKQGNGFTFSGNYADPNGDGNYDDKMIVGEDYSNSFSANFNGNGHTLSNIDIDITNGVTYFAGVFGLIRKMNLNTLSVSNLLIDTINIKGAGEAGGLSGGISEATISNITIKNIGTIKGGGVGGFAGDAGFGASVSNIFIDGVEMIEGSQAGGFLATSQDGNFSNIVIKNIGTINAYNDFYWATAGGFVGQLFYGGNISNVIIDGIGMIKVDCNFSPTPNDYVSTGGYSVAGTGGFVGSSVGIHQIFNVDIKNIGTIEGNYEVGGFIGKMIDTYSAGPSNVVNYYANISLSNINSIKSLGNNNGHYYRAAGFVGFSATSTGVFSNIILNNIKNIEAINNLTNLGYASGFANGGGHFSNIYLYFSENSTIQGYSSNTGKFFSDPNNYGRQVLENVHIYYKNTDLSNATADSSLYANNGIDNSKLNLHTYATLQDGEKLFESAIMGGNVFSTDLKDTQGNPLKIDTTYNHSNGNHFTLQGNMSEGYSFIDTNKLEADINKNLSNPSTDSNPLLTLDMSNLDSYFNYQGFNLDSTDFDISILDSILGKDNQGNSNLIFDLLTQDLESIRQSLDFLVSFLDGENDIKELFGDYYKVNDNIYGALNQDLTINLKFSNFIEALKQNKNINLAFLKDYRDKLNTYNQNKELYQSGGLPSLEQESLKKLLKEQYNELLNLEQTAKINLESLQGLIKDSFKIDTNYAIFAKESLSPLNFTINIGSLNNFEDTQGNGDNNNRFTPPNEVQKIADLASKEAILILPAQEKQEAIVEDGKERGRLCIVSDNAKTNNPCMAITY
ncbi:two-partner secretion domain-containing protein [Helicobacter pullorum]|uniref:two-partner secretion domain-containing protein n=1 Tax=Helicobacter pullorum TaxID=35818 RepID=UPI003F9F2730